MSVCMGAGAASAAIAQSFDPAKINDHPVVSRFQGSTPIGYTQVDFDEMSLPLGPLSADKSRFEKARTVQGKVTRIAYVGPENKSGIEIYRNYKDALAKAGFRIDFECAAQSCGDGFEAAVQLLTARPQVQGEGSKLINTLQATNGDVRVLTAHLDRPTGPVDLTLLVSKDDTRAPGTLLSIVEGKAMDQGQVKVDAKAMASGLGAAGHIALYGIQFKSDSAELTPASDETLAQMAALLKDKPDLKVYIVGHTDNTGAVAHNLSLSQQRAESVVKALSGRYGIAAARLAAKGVASYAPVASNADEAGRAKNRRVELVAQ
ncbi:MAG: OmpA family protein [Burkholderiaceae bacterium]